MSANVFWQGKQWVVTSEGIIQIGAEHGQGYWIDVEQLTNGMGDPDAGWPFHMAGKPWVDLDEFVRAYLIACVVHGVQVENVGDIIEAGYSIRRASQR